MRLGVFGGTFDPVHVGHLIIAGEVLDQGLVDRVLFVPAGEPWLKSSNNVTPAEHRLAMVTRAVAGNPEFEVSDIEVRRLGPTYTVNTLEQLAANPEYGPDLCLILGADAVVDLDRWHMPSRLFDLATIVVVNRAGTPRFDRASIGRFGEAAADKVVFVDAPAIGISGTENRNRVAKGRSIRYLVPDPVEEYINEHGLYRTRERSLSGSTN